MSAPLHGSFCGNETKMAVDRALVTTYRDLAADHIAQMPQIIEQLHARGNFVHVGFNVNLLARNLLACGMMSQRVDADTGAALEYFRTACGFTRELGRALEAIAKSAPDSEQAYLLPEQFEIPLYVCVLAGDWAQAELIARWTGYPGVIDREDQFRALMTWQLAALLRDDEQGFMAVRQKFEKMPKKHKSRQRLIIYADMYDAVMHRDQKRFDVSIEAARVQYLARRRNRDPLRPEYGDGEHNNAVLDFMSVGTARIASRRGLQVRSYSGTLPQALVEAGAEPA
jgi:hypothetical protein